MPTLIGFDDVTFKSEIISLQRHLAGLFSTTHVRREFREGRFLARPYMLVNLVTSTSGAHSQYVSLPVSDYAINYYATDADDSLVAMEKLSALGRALNNRVPVFDYDTDEDNPTVLGYNLRISDVSTDRVPDLEDDQLWSVNCTLQAEGKRSMDKYSGEILTVINFEEE